MLTILDIWLIIALMIVPLAASLLGTPIQPVVNTNINHMVTTWYIWA